MSKKSVTKKTLSALVFCLGTSQASMAATPVRVQALELLQENKISYDEFRKLAGKHSDADCMVTEANYGNMVTAGNYADMITASNYADMVTAGNYGSMVTSGNYGKVDESVELQDIPSPILSNE